MIKVNFSVGTVHAISISPKKGTKKFNVAECEVIKDFGLRGDSHGGENSRQVSLLSYENIVASNSKEGELLPGDFAENITTNNFPLVALRVGDKIKIGDGVVLSVTQLGKTCHDKCEILKKMGSCIMPKKGVFAKVLNGGIIRVNDEIRKII